MNAIDYIRDTFRAASARQHARAAILTALAVAIVLFIIFAPTSWVLPLMIIFAVFSIMMLYFLLLPSPR